MMEAELRLQLGETGEARRLYEAALELARRERPWQRGSPYQVMKLATALGQAAAPSTDAVRLGSSEARQTLARILENANRPLEAERELRDLARDRPEDPDSLRELAEYYQRREQWNDALAAYRRASEIDPGANQQWCEMGSLYEQRGDPRAAEQAYRRPGVTSPVSCMLGLAKLYASRGRQDLALSECRRRPSSFEADELSLLAECEGEVLTSSGDLAGAASAYRKAVWLDPIRAGSRQKLAKAYATLGVADAAALHTWVADRLQQLSRR